MSITKGMSDDEFINFIAAASNAMGIKAEVVSHAPQKIAVSKLQLDVFNQLKRADKLISLEDFCRRYRYHGYTEWEIEKELNQLVDMGILIGGNNIYGCMYGIGNPNVKLYEDEKKKEKRLQHEEYLKSEKDKIKKQIEEIQPQINEHNEKVKEIKEKINILDKERDKIIERIDNLDIGRIALFKFGWIAVLIFSFIGYGFGKESGMIAISIIFGIGWIVGLCVLSANISGLRKESNALYKSSDDYNNEIIKLNEDNAKINDEYNELNEKLKELRY